MNIFESGELLFNKSQNSYFKIIKPFVIVLEWLAQKPHFNVLIWFVLSMILYGIGTYPDYFIIAKNPYTLIPEGSIFQDAILLPIISFTFNLSYNFLGFIIICFVIIFAAYVLYAYLPIKEYGKYGSALSLLVLALHPMMPIQFNGLGLVDGITILLSGLLIYSRTPIILLFASLLGVMNHPIMLIIGPGIALLRYNMDNFKFRKVHFSSIIGGGIVGFLVVKLFLSFNNLTIPVTRINFMVKVGIQSWLRMRISELPLSIFTLYGGILLILILCVYYGYKEKPAFYLTFLGIQAMAFLIIIFTLDPTRIFGLITLPSILLCVQYTLDLAKPKSMDYAYLVSIFFIILVTTVFVPKYFAWEGNIWLYKSAALFGNYSVP